MDMAKDVGINSWAHRHKIKRAIEDVKLKKVDFSDEKEKNQSVTKETEKNIEDRSKNCSDDETIVDQEDDTLEETGNQDDCNLCLEGKEHLCRICGKAVCVPYCSIQDPKSDNESHRVHKTGDSRCHSVNKLSCSKCENIYETADQLAMHEEVIHPDLECSVLPSYGIGGPFECPTCNCMFSTSKELQSHVDSAHEQISSLSLLSEADSSSWMYISCNLCQGKFQNESDMNHHQVRVHEYGEICEMYPCEDCCFKGQDMKALLVHKNEYHGHSTVDDSSDGTSITLEEIGIEKLPEFSKRIKQNFNGLVIDADGQVEIEESDDEYIASDDDEKLLIEEEDVALNQNIRKRKATETQRKPLKKQRSNTQSEEKNTLKCNVCGTAFSRKDNLSRHMRNKHK